MPEKSLNRQLFHVSFLALFLEMALIRWIGVEVRVFAYLSNFVLLACFVGFGIGCFQSARRFHAASAAFLVLVIVFLASPPEGFGLLPFRHITDFLAAPLSDAAVWDARSGTFTARSFLLVAIGTSLTIMLFSLVAAALVPFGRRIGRLFDLHPRPIVAYSVNVVGSLAGSWAFVLLSHLRTPPVVWFGLFLLGILPFMWTCRRERVLWVSIAVGLGVILNPPWGPKTDVFWSPYQKLVMSPLLTGDGRVQRGYQIDVNHTGYQAILNLSDEFLADHPGYFNQTMARLGHYNLPYHFTPKAPRVLILGAGAGNDCAAALRHGASMVDCVEIDPLIAEIGTRYHPEKPYQDPRATLIIDDARSFLGKTENKYDLIIYALLDSHTLSSAYNNLRLDHYVYTKESFSAARRHLTESGVIAIFFEAQRDWIAKRLFGLLETTYGHAPLAFTVRSPAGYYGWGGTLFITGPMAPGELMRRLPPHIFAYLEQNKISLTADVRLSTDDWPYLYLPTNRIPSLHLVVATCLLSCFVIFRRSILRGRIDFDWRFFFLGAGFLLIEVQAVTRAGLLFGSTWIVNSIIISQVFVWILVSNLIYSRWRRIPTGVVFALLMADLAAIWVIPLGAIAGLPPTLRAVVGSMHLTLPVLFSGLIFIDLFSSCPRKDDALGSNLIGSLAGGLTESFAFVAGQSFLMLPAALFYVLAYGLIRRHRAGA